MKTILNIPPEVYMELQKHLLPNIHTNEEAAFVFADVVLYDERVELNYRDWYAVQPNDYKSRSAYHFELTHETNGRIIKRAHDLDACIIEFHSHIDQEFLRFSPTDWKGFSEFVPLVLWRLKGKPYVAIVVTIHGVDALVWTNGVKKPKELSMIKTGATEVLPTNNSLKQDNDEC